MANLSLVVYINELDYGTLISQGLIVKNGITHTYDESALYIIKDVSFPEYAETAGYAYTANSAASASKDSNGNNIIQTYSKKPLIIEVLDDELNISGAYANALNAIAENREVILKVTMRHGDDEVLYLRLYLDYSDFNDELYFGNWECLAVMSSDGNFYFAYASSGEHNHGNITAAGALQATDVAIANGDKLVVTDASNSNKIARTSLSFDGSTTTQALTKKGTFETFIRANDVCKLIENPYVGEYLTFTALSNTTFTFSNNSLQYSTNNGSTWTTLPANTASPTITTGNKILWKLTGLTPSSPNGIGIFSATGNFEVSGNIMSLLYGDNFIGQTDLTEKNYVFRKLFNDNTKLVNAKNLILPATTLAAVCYSFMFYGCTSLITAPELPAITLTNNCYVSMFQGCTSLTTAPELPATTLANNCYSNMFQDCTSLTIAPKLPVTTLISNCYYKMFSGCTSLKYVKCLATDISATNCTTEWLNNVSSSGDFIKNNNMTGWTTGVSGIPTTWLTYNNSLDYDARGYHIERLENTIGDINTILDNIIGY